MNNILLISICFLVFTVKSIAAELNREEIADNNKSLHSDDCWETAASKGDFDQLNRLWEQPEEQRQEIPEGIWFEACHSEDTKVLDWLWERKIPGLDFYDESDNWNVWTYNIYSQYFRKDVLNWLHEHGVANVDGDKKPINLWFTARMYDKPEEVFAWLKEKKIPGRNLVDDKGRNIWLQPFLGVKDLDWLFKTRMPGILSTDKDHNNIWHEHTAGTGHGLAGYKLDEDDKATLDWLRSRRVPGRLAKNKKGETAYGNVQRAGLSKHALEYDFETVIRNHVLSEKDFLSKIMTGRIIVSGSLSIKDSNKKLSFESHVLSYLSDLFNRLQKSGLMYTPRKDSKNKPMALIVEPMLPHIENKVEALIRLLGEREESSFASREIDESEHQKLESIIQNALIIITQILKRQMTSGRFVVDEGSIEVKYDPNFSKGQMRLDGFFSNGSFSKRKREEENAHKGDEPNKKQKAEKETLTSSSKRKREEENAHKGDESNKKQKAEEETPTGF